MLMKVVAVGETTRSRAAEQFLPVSRIEFGRSEHSRDCRQRH